MNNHELTLVQVSITPNALTSCDTRASEDQTTTIECGLNNPTLAGSTLQLEIYFMLNDTAIPLTTTQLEIRFSIVDGVSQTEAAAQTLSIGLDAVAGFKVTSRYDKLVYRLVLVTIFYHSIGKWLLVVVVLALATISYQSIGKWWLGKLAIFPSQCCRGELSGLQKHPLY